jgi:hypothetical protein
VLLFTAHPTSFKEYDSFGHLTALLSKYIQWETETQQ